MIKEGNTDDKILALEKEVARLKRKTRGNAPWRVTGAVAGAGVTYGVAGNWVREKADAMEELYHDFRVASNLLNFGEGEAAYYIGYIDGVVANEFLNYRNNESRLTDISRESLQALQRASAAFPGQQTKVVEAAKGIKGTIFEMTMGMVANEEEEEDNAMRGTKQYQKNYNELAQIRVSALERRELLREEMDGLAVKLKRTELNTGQIDQSGINSLEALARKYNCASDVLNDILNMRVITAYEKDEGYQAIVQQAREYGIKPYQPGEWADNAVTGALILGAYVGNRLGRTAGNIYRSGRELANVAAKPIKYAARGIAWGAKELKNIRSRGNDGSQ